MEKDSYYFNWNGRAKPELTITMHLKPLMGAIMGGMFKKNLSNLIDSALEDLQVYAETGKPSQRKLDRIAKLAMKAA